MVYSTRAAAAVKYLPRSRPAQITQWATGDATDSNDAIVVSLNWEEIRRFMWSYVGIVRSDKRLERARRRIENVRDEIRQYYLDFKVTNDLIELRNLALVANLIIESARRRKESRGLHYTLDYPDKQAEPRHSELQLTNGPASK
jgi:L-aspartate oxidase